MTKFSSPKVLFLIGLGLLVMTIVFMNRNSANKKQSPVEANTPTEISDRAAAEIVDTKEVLSPSLAIVTNENGRRIFTDLGWRLYTAQFIKPKVVSDEGCSKDESTCPYWEALAKQHSVNVSDVKYVLYDGDEVGLNDKYQKIYDNYNVGLYSLTDQTDEAGEAFEKSFALKNGLKDYELKAIVIKGMSYKPETSTIESFVRKALTETNKIIDANSLVKIDVFENLGTKETSLDKIVHIYYKPKSVWDEKGMVRDTASKALNSMKVLFTNPEITHIVFWTLGDFTDSYGKTSESTAIRVGLKSTTASKINWDNFIPMVEVDYNKLFDIADDKYVHPAIAKKLNFNWR